MTNEDRLRAMRWAAKARLELKKGDIPERKRDQSLVAIVDQELEFAAHGMATHEADGIALAMQMQVAFDRLGGCAPQANEEAPEFDGLSG